MPKSKHLVLNVNVLGLGQRPGAWRATTLSADSFIDIDYWVGLANAAERAKLDGIFLADFPQLSEDPQQRVAGNLDPSTVLTHVADHTSNIGLIATATTTFNDPVELAQRLLSLDIVSGGRAAWNIVTTYGSDAAAQNFGSAQNPTREERYDRADEFIDLVRKLWRDVASNSVTVHDGEHFQVETALDLIPSAQGHPVIVQAGGSPQGRDIAARYAELVFTAEMTYDAGKEHYRQVKEAARGYGRRPEDIRILPGLSIVLGSTEQEAIDRYDEWERLGPEGYGFKRLVSVLGEELRELPLDQPLPSTILDRDVSANTLISLGFRESLIRYIKETGATVRQLIRYDGGYGHRFFVGTPEEAADTIEHWFRSGAADGFNIMPGVFPQGFDDFAEQVVPILQARGLFRNEYESSTLRSRL